MRTISRRTFARAAVAAALTVTTLSACGDSGGAEGANTASTTPSAPAEALTVQDPWVKASEGKEMTAAFGTLVNNTGQDVIVRGATSPVSPLELHEMAMDGDRMVMRPKEGGITVKANGTHELAPGGDHLMLMKPSAPIKPGDEVQFTLILGDGTTVSFAAVAKPFAGAQESYAPSMAPSMGGMAK
jgi:copper(I)-binding protein